MNEYIIVYAVTNSFRDSLYVVKFYNLTVVNSSKKGAIDYFYRKIRKDDDTCTLINVIEL